MYSSKISLSILMSLAIGCSAASLPGNEKLILHRRGAPTQTTDILDPTQATGSPIPDAIWAVDAAVPSAGCNEYPDPGAHEFYIWGINGWAGEDGAKLKKELKGCDLPVTPTWFPDQWAIFEGRNRSTQGMKFTPSTYKGGCIERAINRAGGPPPAVTKGDGLYKVGCVKLSLEVYHLQDWQLFQPPAVVNAELAALGYS